jgi:ferredoxin-type protein NapG
VIPPLVMRYPQTAADVSRLDGSTRPAAENTPPPVPKRPAIVPVLRPPGAIDEASFLAGCTRCNECMEACPYDAILPAPSRMRQAAGTPMIDPDVSPCLMCSDAPCVNACEPKVLSHQASRLMGTARITEQLCLAHHGTTCTVCDERCPVSGAIRCEGGKPMIDESRCTGCGVCRFVCPAPENAILLMPIFARPPRPASPTG